MSREAYSHVEKRETQRKSGVFNILEKRKHMSHIVYIPIWTPKVLIWLDVDILRRYVLCIIYVSSHPMPDHSLPSFPENNEFITFYLIVTALS